MAITVANLVARAREALTEQPEEIRFSPERLYALIPAALELWLARNKSDARKVRGLLAQTAAITITNGVADCSSEIDSKAIQIAYLRADDCVIESSADGDDFDYNLSFVNSRGRLRLGGIQSHFYLEAYFDGKKMYFRDPQAPLQDNPLTSFNGTIIIRGVSSKTTLADVAAIYEGELSLTLAEVARNYNTDGDSKFSALNFQKQSRKQ